MLAQPRARPKPAATLTCLTKTTASLGGASLAIYRKTGASCTVRPPVNTQPVGNHSHW